jgi:hypothetical protein
MRKTYRVIAALITVLCAFGCSAMAATYYLDSSVATSGNGQSWSTAWKNFSNISGLVAGDTVYISGGSTSQTYTLDSWMPSSGTSGRPITYQVGQDAGHNGTVIFTGGTHWIGNGNTATLQYITINGLGSDGTNRMAVQGYSDYPIYCESGTNCVHISFLHINFTETAGFRFSNSAAIELGYNSIIKSYWGSDGTHDDVIWACQESSSGAYDCLIHDNYISYPVYSGNSALGDDCIKWGQGMQVYNNHFHANLTTYSSNQGTAQHSDGFQVNVSHYKVYNNLFEDIGESFFYHDDFDTPRSIEGIYIYNNLFVQSHAAGTNVARAIDILPESNGIGTSFTDVVVANNDFVDMNGFSYIIRVASITSCTNCHWQNNIDYNNIGNYQMSGLVTQSNNSTGASFVSHTQYAVSTNNLHLASNDTANIGQGTNLSTYFTTDKDGVSRPQSSAWDIGAYEFVSTTALSPPTNLTATVQ